MVFWHFFVWYIINIEEFYLVIPILHWDLSIIRNVSIENLGNGLSIKEHYLPNNTLVFRDNENWQMYMK